ncbi:hypothetical protein BU25DRAFT_178567 [Macroventuria anomochaeta]|uniref:Uncharacterized protein n=1 Tax=Macroventuria anomochaeta TaxID=301207 RepID=A0ACB6RN90_9PLEO|nr:uncharacterized protein BU25DRAFT_178567 [Macroventuria anomochaeta]KAF2623396.1 hypothetical protein BU25DRAFT_178567 [Macroventuria anomochaeta]
MASLTTLEASLSCSWSETIADLLVVYREFDCCDPLARAPTPLPPMFSDDKDDDGQIDIMINKPAQPLEGESVTTSIKTAALEPDTPCPRPNGTAASTFNPRTPEDIRCFAIEFLANSKQSKTVRQDELNIASQGKDNIVSKLEDIVATSEQADTTASLNPGHKLCGASRSADEDVNKVKMLDTPPESPVKVAFGVQTTSPASTISTLSPVPSNLSDQDKDLGIKVSISSCFEATMANWSRSIAFLPHLEALQVCTTPHQRLQLDRRLRLQRLAAWLRKLLRILRASLARQRGRKTVWRTSHCWNCTQGRLCAKVDEGDQLGRRNRKATE